MIWEEKKGTLVLISGKKRRCWAVRNQLNKVIFEMHTSLRVTKGSKCSCVVYSQSWKLLGSSFDFQSETEQWSTWVRLMYGFWICFMQWFSLGFVKRSKLKRSPIVVKKLNLIWIVYWYFRRTNQSLLWLACHESSTWVSRSRLVNWILVLLLTHK